MMNYAKMIVVFLVMFAGGVHAQGNESHILVKVSNFDGSREVKDVTPAQLAELKKDITLENTLIKDAYTTVLKDWRTAHENDTIDQVIYNNQARTGNNQQPRTVKVKRPAPPIPLKKPNPREIFQVGVFPTAEAAAVTKKSIEATLKSAAKKTGDVENKDKPEVSEKAPKKDNQPKIEAQKKDDQGSSSWALYQQLMDELAKLKEAAQAKKKTK